MDKVVQKRWGKELWIKVTDKYALKILKIKRGKGISLQYHKKKEETWYITKGKGKVIFRDENNILLLNKGDHLHITPGTIHKIDAIEDLEILEASTTELDDVIRLRY